MKRRFAVAGVVCVAAALLAPTTAGATHRHALQTGNGACVVLAQSGGERFVTLPQYEGTTNPHPLHVFVHLGAPGERVSIGVYGTATDPCASTGDYVNVP
ncbi:MAG TPA: hypothetical protein VFB44_02385 [Thermoleophilaceae bacterium]|nr:hypothetical protein [Thermoleophilaceae bacterium]